MSHDGVGPRSVLRSAAFLTTGVLAVTTLAGCSSDQGSGSRAAAQDIAPAARERIADGGTLRWAVDAVPQTMNAFQADADASTQRVADAVLPAMFRLDAQGRAQRDADYLESAEVVEQQPKQVVVYKLNQQAVWSDGREISAADFVAQWRALSGKNSAYWTARNAGYDRIEKIERGKDALEVRVTFAKHYADWRSLFSPLYPKDVMGTPDTFNDAARRKLKVTAGPFGLANVDTEAGEVTLKRSAHWWGRPAKLSSIVLRSVPRGKRAAALAKGTIDVAEVDPAVAKRIAKGGQDTAGGAGAKGRGAADKNAADKSAPDKSAAAKGAMGAPAQRPQGFPGGQGAHDSAGALRSWAVAHGSDEEAADAERAVRAKDRKAAEKSDAEQRGLNRYVVRRSLEPAYTQLALNGSSGPLSDERVRRAVARAIDRDKLAHLVLSPLGLPAAPVDSHLALAGQGLYADGSGALGDQDTDKARALLADAGWVRGGAITGTKDGKKEDKAAEEAKKDGAKKGEAAGGEAAEGAKGEGAKKKGEHEKRSGAEKKEAGKKSDDEKKAHTGKSGEAGKPEKAEKPHTGHDKPDAGHEKSRAEEKKSTDHDKKSDSGTDDKPAADRPAAGAGAGVLSPAALARRSHTASLVQADAFRLDLNPAEAAAGAPEQPARAAQDGRQHLGRGGVPGAYAPKGTAAPAGAQAGALAKDGKPLTLRMVVPSGPGSESLRAVGERISRMLARIGIRTETSKVADDSYFQDHVAAGQYDLALYSWPASAFPATDARPIFAKPVPAADGSLNVEQNYTRVGTDRIDQLFDQAAAELDGDKERDLMRKADARIWAEAGSIPLYQRPELVAVRKNLVNTGAFGFGAPRYEDMGFLKHGNPGPAAAHKKGRASHAARPSATATGTAGKSGEHEK